MKTKYITASVLLAALADMAGSTQSDAQSYIAGLTADGNSMLYIGFADDLAPKSCTIWTTNAASVGPYNPNCLSDPPNDGVVAETSQIDGEPHSLAIFNGLAHTTPPLYTSLVGAFSNLSGNNVQTNPGIAGAVYNLLMTASFSPDSTSVPKRFNADQPRTDRIMDPSVPIRITNRFVEPFPKAAPLGSIVNLKIRFPFRRVGGVFVREQGESWNLYQSFEARIEPTPDGLTNVAIPVLTCGHVRFAVTALFRDNAISSKDFMVDVLQPVEKPITFSANRLTQSGDRQLQMRLHIGESLTLEPIAAFTTAPRSAVPVAAAAKFHVLPQPGAPVIAVDPSGKVTGLREGSATVQVVLGGYTADQPVMVRSDKPIKHCTYTPDHKAFSCFLEP